MGLSILWRLLHDQWTLDAILLWICVLWKRLERYSRFSTGCSPCFTQIEPCYYFIIVCAYVNYKEDTSNCLSDSTSTNTPFTQLLYSHHERFRYRTSLSKSRALRLFRSKVIVSSFYP